MRYKDVVRVSKITIMQKLQGNHDGKGYVLSVGAIGSLRTPSCEIIQADDLASVFVSTVGSMLTESTSIPWTVLNFTLWVDVKILRYMDIRTMLDVHWSITDTQATQVANAFFKRRTYYTFCAIITLAVFAIKPAFGHFSKVVFVQKLAVVALFAETTKPVFADYSLGRIRPDMSKLTVISF